MGQSSSTSYSYITADKKESFQLSSSTRIKGLSLMYNPVSARMWEDGYEQIASLLVGPRYKQTNQTDVTDSMCVRVSSITPRW